MQVVRKLEVAAAAALLTVWACTPAAGGDTSPERPETAESPAAQAPSAPGPEAGHAWVIFGADTVVAEVARTPDEREQGLMGRQEVPDGTGMLFVFDDAAVRSFWMQNTFVALDIAFLDVSLRVINVQQMEPETTDPHDSTGPAMFALEVRKGWFAEHGIRTGSQAQVVFGR